MYVVIVDSIANAPCFYLARVSRFYCPIRDDVRLLICWFFSVTGCNFVLCLSTCCRPFLTSLDLFLAVSDVDHIKSLFLIKNLVLIGFMFKLRGSMTMRCITAICCVVINHRCWMYYYLMLLLLLQYTLWIKPINEC